MVIHEREKSQFEKYSLMESSSFRHAQPPNLLRARANIDIIFITLKLGIMGQSYGLIEPRTNNEVEYEALVVGLEEVIFIGI